MYELLSIIIFTYLVLGVYYFLRVPVSTKSKILGGPLVWFVYFIFYLYESKN